jgi:hypothetical protein
MVAGFDIEYHLLLPTAAIITGHGLGLPAAIGRQAQIGSMRRPPAGLTPVPRGKTK